VANVKTSADVNTYANDLYARDFAGKTDMAVANILLANLNLSSVTGLNNWVAAQLTAAGAGNKGAKLVSMLNDFAGMTADTTYGSYANSFNAKVNAALVLAVMPAKSFNMETSLAPLLPGWRSVQHHFEQRFLHRSRGQCENIR